LAEIIGSADRNSASVEGDGLESARVRCDEGIVPQQHAQLDPQPLPGVERMSLSRGAFPFDMKPKPPLITRRIGLPVSGCLVSGLSFMLC